MDSFASPESTQNSPSHQQGPELPSVAELEKMERFKFDGQEWTAKDLKNAYLRQQDYTRKTQELAELRKGFEQERKYYENLYADLQYVKDNPQFAQKFIETYPQKFHQLLQRVLGDSSSQPQMQQQQSSRGPDVELMSRLSNLEKFYHEQEVKKNETEINTTLKELETKYPDAITEMVMGRVYEAYNRMLQQDPSAKLTKQMWEDSFKSVDSYMKDLVNTRYRSKQQEQLKANKRSSDVSPGGATVGRAPQKFKDLKSVTEFAVRDLTGRS